MVIKMNSTSDITPKMLLLEDPASASIVITKVELFTVLALITYIVMYYAFRTLKEAYPEPSWELKI